MQLLFIGLAAAPIDPPALRLLLPIVQPARMLRQVMVNNRQLSDLHSGDLFLLLGNAALWLTLGMFILSRMLRAARSRGTLGHY